MLKKDNIYNKRIAYNKSHMDFGFDNNENNNNNENKMSSSEYLAKELKEHPPRNEDGFNLQRFSFVQSTMGDRRCYILVNIIPIEVGIDGVKTFYIFKGIEVFDEELEKDVLYATAEKELVVKEKVTGIKEESMVTVLERLKTKIEPLVYYDEVDSNESQEHRVTEIDLNVLGPPIITGTTWMSQFDENDKTVVEDKINKKIELLQNKGEKTPAPSSPKRRRKKLYESDLKF